ncbi:16S rRNA (adenine(1518)-N(6)/adenine(1519)-N(6))-dimethyltransferase RsmA [Pelagibacteraceae bacterium]|nr:16S rRNA (adenine(1518)-N(6)/adenine(1519)-N(6))-dimethyltransferase RsmA [Pelagibacteraceae bacterium]
MKEDKLITKKSLGQNFITDENFLKKLSSLIITNKNSLIIEIGPGRGALTKELVKKNINKISLVEKDDNLIENLHKFSKEFKNLEIIHQDALKIDYNDFLKKNSIIVGNLPFNISTKLLMNWVLLNRWPPLYNKMYLMFQKEVAERILAKNGTKEYGRLSVITQSRCVVKKLITAKSKIFNPQPKVDGMVLEFTPHKETLDMNINNLEIIVRKAFSQRRKKIKTTLSPYIHYLDSLSIDSSLRPENLSVQQYCNLARLMK